MIRLGYMIPPDELGLGGFVYGPRLELDLTEVLSTGNVRTISERSARLHQAPAHSAPGTISEAVLVALRVNKLAGPLTEGVEWPKTMDKQVNLLDEMFAEYKEAVQLLRVGVKDKADNVDSLRQTVQFLSDRLSTAMHNISCGTWAFGRSHGGY